MYVIGLTCNKGTDILAIPIALAWHYFWEHQNEIYMVGRSRQNSSKVTRVWLAIPAIITVLLRVVKDVTRYVFEVTRYVIHVTCNLNYVTLFLS